MFRKFHLSIDGTAGTPVSAYTHIKHFHSSFNNIQLSLYFLAHLQFIHGSVYVLESEVIDRSYSFWGHVYCIPTMSDTVISLVDVYANHDLLM
jgi:hypothetical protein